MAEIAAEILGWLLGIVSAVAGGGILYALRRIDRMRDEIRDHRISCAQSFVHRGDWVREHTALEARLDRLEVKLDSKITEVAVILGEIRERVVRNERR